MTGFDYRDMLPKDRTPAEWREEVRAVVAEGGRRRVENGETFAHGTDGTIAFEVYGRVPA